MIGPRAVLRGIDSPERLVTILLNGWTMGHGGLAMKKRACAGTLSAHE
jgi:hypothetical protein